MVKWLLRDGHLSFDGQVVGFFFFFDGPNNEAENAAPALPARSVIFCPGQFFARRLRTTHKNRTTNIRGEYLPFHA